jgi:peroxiredoxin
VLTVSRGKDDPKEALEKFMAEKGYSFKVLLDRDWKITKTYKVTRIPFTVVIGRNQKISKKIIGTTHNWVLKRELDKLLK